jgi:hypothetical protein
MFSVVFPVVQMYVQISSRALDMLPDEFLQSGMYFLQVSHAVPEVP